MEKSYKRNIKPRKIIFILNERANWKGKGSVKHLRFSGKLRPCQPQAHVQVRQSCTFHTSKYLTKQLQSSVSVKKLGFLVLCLNVFCSKLVIQLSGRFALMGLYGVFLLLNFDVVGSYWIFSSGFWSTLKQMPGNWMQPFNFAMSKWLMLFRSSYS